MVLATCGRFSDYAGPSTTTPDVCFSLSKLCTVPFWILKGTLVYGLGLKSITGRLPGGRQLPGVCAAGWQLGESSGLNIGSGSGFKVQGLGFRVQGLGL